MDDIKIRKYMGYIKKDMESNTRTRRADIFLESLSAEEAEELRQIIAGRPSVETCVKKGSEWKKLLSIKNLSHADKITLLRKIPQEKMLLRLGVYLNS